MTDIVKGIAADINPQFFEKIKAVFPLERAVWAPGKTEPEVAYDAGIQYLIAWIKQHARM